MDSEGLKFEVQSRAAGVHDDGRDGNQRAEEPYRMTSVSNQIDPDVPPSGTGCVECLAGASPGWWLHLRRCAACGHVGCCDNSPGQHATAHSNATGHSVLQSFEPGEDWFYDYRSGEFLEGPALAAPDSHPVDQPVPGPAGAVPADWERHLN